MKLYVGKFYVALRLRNDLCIGVGKPSAELRAQVVRARPHRGV